MLLSCILAARDVSDCEPRYFSTVFMRLVGIDALSTLCRRRGIITRSVSNQKSWKLDSRHLINHFCRVIGKLACDRCSDVIAAGMPGAGQIDPGLAGQLSALTGVAFVMDRDIRAIPWMSAGTRVCPRLFLDFVTSASHRRQTFTFYGHIGHISARSLSYAVLHLGLWSRFRLPPASKYNMTVAIHRTEQSGGDPRSVVSWRCGRCFVVPQVVARY